MGRCAFRPWGFYLRIEPESPGLAYLDVTKMLKLYRDERTAAHAIIRDIAGSLRLKATIGIGNSRIIARQAALCAWDALVVERGAEKDFLSLLSVDALPVSEKEKEHLRLLGLTTLKKVARLDKKALLSQFGTMGAATFEIVNGNDDKRPIPLRAPSLCLEREFASDAPLWSSREIRGAMKGMVAELSDELKGLRMTARKVCVTFRLQNGRSMEKTLVMKQSPAKGESMLLRIDGMLERLALESPLVSFRITVPGPVPFEGNQECLFHKRSAFLERLDGIKSYFTARYGYTPIMKVEEGDEHSRLPERRFRFADV